MTYRTLVIAPKSDLPLVENELQQTVNILSAKMLRVGATLDGLLEMFDQPFDIIWFAAHGDESGVHLNDGILTTSEITTLVRSCGAKLIVLNTCSSWTVADAIYRELRTDLVCTIKTVPDRTAYILGVIFARKLADGLTSYEAYEAAKPGQNTTYAFIGNKESTMPINERPPRTDDELSNIKDSLRRIETIVSGNPQWNVYGLVPEVRELRNKVEQLIADMVATKANQLFNRRLLIFLSVICSGLLVTVVVLLTQRGAW